MLTLRTANCGWVIKRAEVIGLSRTSTDQAAKLLKKLKR